MALLTKAALKLLFETGDIPTEQNFADFIDSYANILDDIQATVNFIPKTQVNGVTVDSQAFDDSINMGFNKTSGFGGKFHFRGAGTTGGTVNLFLENNDGSVLLEYFDNGSLALTNSLGSQQVLIKSTVNAAQLILDAAGPGQPEFELKKNGVQTFKMRSNSASTQLEFFVTGFNVNFELDGNSLMFINKASKLVNFTSGGGIGIGLKLQGAGANNVAIITDGAVGATVAGAAQLFVLAGELFVKNGTGVVTQLS